MRDSDLIAVLVARLGGYVTVSETELEAAREFRLVQSINSVSKETSLLIRQ